MQPATVRKTYRVLSMMLDLAVADGRLARNPCARVKLPRPAPAARRYSRMHEYVTLQTDAPRLRS
jgi:hypothetical protein